MAKLLSFSFLSPSPSVRSTSIQANAKKPFVEQRDQIQDVVIVGAGIAGLGTALALHRMGVKSLVLEQFDSLRVSGTAIGVWQNAWRALEVLGVADSLRPHFTKLHEIEFYLDDGSLLKNIPLMLGNKEVELRAVDRKALLSALAEPLPTDAVCLNARAVGIHRNLQTGFPVLELEDGSTIQTKVLVGCDGIRSIVGKWMGFQEPRFVGYHGIRGITRYPDGHNFKPVGRQILGRGVRAGLIPMDQNRIYWFLAFNCPLGAGRITDPYLIKQEALKCVQGWPEEVVETISSSSCDTLTRNSLRDRWLWPFITPKLYNDGVTLAGDALHPMTPNLGQGGCCALEDAVILARKLSVALKGGVTSHGIKDHYDSEMIKSALEAYSKERWSRVFALTIRSFMTGAFLQWDAELVCRFRNFILPKILDSNTQLGHVAYDCGELPS